MREIRTLAQLLGNSTGTY